MSDFMKIMCWIRYEEEWLNPCQWWTYHSLSKSLAFETFEGWRWKCSRDEHKTPHLASTIGV
jgi:hypothetical protein